MQDQLTQLAHGPGARLPDAPDAALAVLRQRISQQALLHAFNHNFLLLAFAFVGASWLVLLMRRPDPRSAVDTKGAH